MKKSYFIKQSHKEMNVVSALIFLICAVFAIIVMIKRQGYYISSTIFLAIALLLCVFLAKCLNGYGLYITEEGIYYKTIRRKAIDIKKIACIKVLQAEAQVNISWSPFDLKDQNGSPLFTMVCLSVVNEDIRNDKHGEIRFLQRHKKHVICHTVYNKVFMDYLKACNPNIVVFDTERAKWGRA